MTFFTVHRYYILILNRSARKHYFDLRLLLPGILWQSPQILLFFKQGDKAKKLMHPIYFQGDNRIIPLDKANFQLQNYIFPFYHQENVSIVYHVKYDLLHTSLLQLLKCIIHRLVLTFTIWSP